MKSSRRIDREKHEVDVVEHVLAGGVRAVQVEILTASDINESPRRLRPAGDPMPRSHEGRERRQSR